MKLGLPSRGDRPHQEWVGKVVGIGKAAGFIVDEGDPITGRGPKLASTHDLRCTFAVLERQAGIPPQLIRKLLRHSDYQGTERYAMTETPQEDAGQIRKIMRNGPRGALILGHSSS